MRSCRQAWAAATTAGLASDQAFAPGAGAAARRHQGGGRGAGGLLAQPALHRGGHRRVGEHIGGVAL
ncbi:MAG: hypothetical protein L6R48_20695, partial [Planctomycetes bacterium]|nr:hypothetical protein [Planctomycetota bacterium]